MLSAVSLMLLMPAYFFGLGCLLFPLCKSVRAGLDGYDDSRRLQLLAGLLVLGVELNYALVLAVTRLSTSLLAGLALSLAGAGAYLLFRRRRLCSIISPAWLALTATLYLACLFAVMVEPVSGWDARSIWFFHAKMVYYHASVAAAGDWSLPSVIFSHPDYPKLVPTLAAQIAYSAGFWNEYLPKLGLVALLCPALLSLISVLRGTWWQMACIALPLFFLNVWLKNGYMDGYLALYAGLATLFLGRWLWCGHRLDLICGILHAGVALGLKNEGVLYVLIATGMLLVCVLADARRRWDGIGPFCREILPFLLIACSGPFLWLQKKLLFGLTNDLALGGNSLARVSARLQDGWLPTIVKALYVADDVNLSLGIFLLGLVAALRTGRRPTVAVFFCFGVALLYFSGIAVVYLATPFELRGFHLPTGNRTMLPVHLILLAATLALFLGPARTGSQRPTVPA